MCEASVSIRSQVPEPRVPRGGCNRRRTVRQAIGSDLMSKSNPALACPLYPIRQLTWLILCCPRVSPPPRDLEIAVSDWKKNIIRRILQGHFADFSHETFRAIYRLQTFAIGRGFEFFLACRSLKDFVFLVKRPRREKKLQRRICVVPTCIIFLPTVQMCHHSRASNLT